MTERRRTRKCWAETEYSTFSGEPKVFSRCLEPAQVKAGFKLIDHLIEAAKKYNDATPLCPSTVDNRIRQLIIQTLREQRYHLYHHLLGEDFSALDLDLLEIRSNLYKYLTSITMSPNKPSDWGAYHYKQLADKIGVPYLEIIAKLSTEHFNNPEFQINGVSHDFSGWKVRLF